MEHVEYVDPNDSSKRTRVRLNVEGPHGHGLAYAEVMNNEHDRQLPGRFFTCRQAGKGHSPSLIVTVNFVLQHENANRFRFWQENAGNFSYWHGSNERRKGKGVKVWLAPGRSLPERFHLRVRGCVTHISGSFSYKRPRDRFIFFRKLLPLARSPIQHDASTFIPKT